MGSAVERTRDALLARGAGGLVIDDLTQADLSALAWSGSPGHIRSVAGYLDRVASGAVEYLVARDLEGQPVAKAGILYEEAGVGEIMQLVARYELQGLGVGTVLIAAAEERIRRRGVPVARLGVEDDNPRARGLYERLGYRPVGRRPVSWEAEAPDGSLFEHHTVITELEKDLGLSVQTQSGGA